MMTSTPTPAAVRRSLTRTTLLNVTLPGVVALANRSHYTPGQGALVVGAMLLLCGAAVAGARRVRDTGEVTRGTLWTLAVLLGGCSLLVSAAVVVPLVAGLPLPV